MRTPLLSLFFLTAPFALPLEGTLPPTSILHNKFQQAQPGDFIVTAYERSYSLLFIRSLDPKTLLLEEVVIPESQIDLKTVNWQQWLSQRAPGHTSWTLYEIDLHSGALLETFSYSQNGWLCLDESQTLISKLFSLPLEKLSHTERRKIGPPPQSGETDHRALWNPPLVIKGKKMVKPQFEVWKTRWPEDNSLLSGCTVELYFSQHDPSFAFPRWIDLQSPHYTFKLRSVDSGSGLHSPFTGPMPHRPPQFTGTPRKTTDRLILTATAPLYQNSFTLYAIDLTTHTSPLHIPHTILRQDSSPNIEIHIDTKQLSSLLSPQHTYKWALIPDADRTLYAESSEPFLFP